MDTGTSAGARVFHVEHVSVSRALHADARPGPARRPGASFAQFPLPGPPPGGSVSTWRGAVVVPTRRSRSPRSRGDRHGHRHRRTVADGDGNRRETSGGIDLFGNPRRINGRCGTSANAGWSCRHGPWLPGLPDVRRLLASRRPRGRVRRNVERERPKSWFPPRSHRRRGDERPGGDSEGVIGRPPCELSAVASAGTLIVRVSLRRCDACLRADEVACCACASRRARPRTVLRSRGPGSHRLSPVGVGSLAGVWAVLANGIPHPRARQAAGEQCFT